MWKTLSRRRCVAAALACIIAVGIIMVFFDSFLMLNYFSAPQKPFNVIPVQTQIPKVIHQMWKNSYPQSELRAYQHGCKDVNQDHQFRFYTDDQLDTFIMQTYPEYYEYYSSLNGVFAADMARLLVVYHYGGIYMDLDFYCHRPFTCLVNSLAASHHFDADPDADILAVSKEPFIHAHLLWYKERVVIQDFFMATPRHPFIRWLLDDRLHQFEAISDPAENRIITKKPFSNCIEADIDRYKELLRTAQTSPSTSSSLPSSKQRKEPLIIELDEAILHPLIDTSNGRFKVECERLRSSAYSLLPLSAPTSATSSISATSAISATSRDIDVVKTNLRILQEKSCDFYEAGRYLNPSEDTVAVHMWSHVYWGFGWNLIRKFYSWSIHSEVRSTLPPMYSCAA